MRITDIAKRVNTLIFEFTLANDNDIIVLSHRYEEVIMVYTHVFTREKLQHLIGAIQQILLKKDEIQYCVRHDEVFFMELGNNVSFRSTVAVCNNFFLDLRQVELDHDVFSVSDTISVYYCLPTLAKYLCIKFVKKTKNGVRLEEAASYPVGGEREFDYELASSWRYDSDRKTPTFWLNERRWEFLKFVKDELEQLLETNVLEQLK